MRMSRIYISTRACWWYSRSTETYFIGSYVPSNPGLLESVYQIVVGSVMQRTDEGNDLIMKERSVYKKKVKTYIYFLIGLRFPISSSYTSLYPINVPFRKHNPLLAHLCNWSTGVSVEVFNRATYCTHSKRIARKRHYGDMSRLLYATWLDVCLAACVLYALNGNFRYPSWVADCLATATAQQNANTHTLIPSAYAPYGLSAAPVARVECLSIDNAERPQ